MFAKRQGVVETERGSVRLGVEVFDLPWSEIRTGYRSAVYFNRSKQVMRSELPTKEVTMQVFQKNNAVLCGMDEALAILRVGTGYFSDEEKAAALFSDYLSTKFGARNARSLRGPALRGEMLQELAEVEDDLDALWVDCWDQLRIEALHDGDEVAPWEPVMHITGPLSTFMHLESVYLGVLARRTKIATNVRRVVEAANGKPILFFADRFDMYTTQGGDGHAAHVGGAQSVASDAMGAWWGEKGIGTMPHALVAAFENATGDGTLLASAAFHKYYPEVPLIALVDFTNDCVKQAARAYQEFGDSLYGVRLDTSENMVDESIVSASASNRMGDFKPTGVNPALVHHVRSGLDRVGGYDVKIIVSGGFNADKIRQFEEANVPADIYAVGSSLLQGSCDFTADVVYPYAKKGRWFRASDRLELVV